MRSAARITLCAVLAAASFAFLTSPADATTMQWGFQVNGAFNTHSMNDWNDIIDEANEFGSNYDNITSGFSFGAGPVLILNQQWILGAHFERLMPKTSEDQGIEIENSGNAFGASVGYLFPSASPMSFGLGVALDFITLSGSLSDPSDEFDTEGSGIGFQMNGMGRYAFNPMWSGVASVGYRIADIEIDNIGGQDVSSSGLDTEDYSGVMVRVGIELHQPTP